MFGLESGRRVQRRYNLSETTLQQSKLRGMVHNYTRHNIQSQFFNIPVSSNNKYPGENKST